MSERMIFCLGENDSKGIGYQSNNMIFNKVVSEETFNKYYNNQPDFKLPVSVWVEEKDMTKEEKKYKPIYKEIGGYLKVLDYKNSWKEGWKTASKEFKDWVKNLPNFNSEVFEEITGIEWENNNLSGKEVEVKLDGVVYKAVIK